jgi:hypothetical protein
MRITALEQLAERGVVTIQKKGDSWFVECILKDEAGFLVSRQAEWGRELRNVIIELWEKVRNAE